MSEATLPPPGQTAPRRLSEDHCRGWSRASPIFPAGPPFARRRGRARLAGDDVGMDRSLRRRLRPYRKPMRASGGPARFLLLTWSLTAVLSAGAYLLGDDVKTVRARPSRPYLRSPMRAGSSAPGPISPPSPRPIRRSSASPGRSGSQMRADTSSRLSLGLVIANAFPAFADRLRSAVRPELYIKSRDRHPRRLHRGHHGEQAHARVIADAARTWPRSSRPI